MKAIRIMLVDDHELVRTGFRSLLNNLTGIEIVAEAGDGSQALQMVEVHRPDIVLMDIAMPGLSGLEATLQMTQKYPATRVIIVSMHANSEYARRAVRAGAAGYLLKDSNTAELEMAIRAVARGETYLTPTISKHIMTDYARRMDEDASPLDRLTPRQREILALLAEGYSRKEIAKRLNISVKTFDTYRQQLMQQLDIHDRAGLTQIAAQMGLVIPEE